MDNVLANLDHTYQHNDLHPHSQPIIIPLIPNIMGPTASFENLVTSTDVVSTHASPMTVHPLQGPETGTMKATARLLQKASGAINPPTTTIQVHVDGGANRSITNNTDYLLRFRNIKKYPMSGVAAGDAALICTGMGYLPWQSDTGVVVLVKCYFSQDAADTIISPTDIVVNNITDYNAWSQYSNMDTGTGHITLHRRDEDAPITFQLNCVNCLWYHSNFHDYIDYQPWSSRHLQAPVIQRLTKEAEYYLAHLRYGCAGQRCLSLVHHDVDNQPKIRMHSFFKCLACMLATGDSRSTTTPAGSNTVNDFDDWFDDEVATAAPCDPGQHFHVDFGFMKGSGYCKQDEEGRTITSIDGFQSYLLIIDRKTRYIWVFLTKSKKPPLAIFAQFLQEHGHPTAQNRTVRSDKGGELWGSQAFRDVVHKAGYIMDPTAPKAAFQNAKAERPNRNFGKTVRCLLYNANLGPEYWSFALLHAVFLKNRLRHSTTNQVPLTAYTGKRPNAKRLRVFGCPIVVRHQTRKAKLDLNTSAGIFLGYSATNKNVVYRDSVTGRFKTATHVVFDEAGMTLPAAERSPAAKVLQDLGYGQRTGDDEDDTDVSIQEHDLHDPSAVDNVITPPAMAKPTSPISVVERITHDTDLQVQCLSIHATLPVRATDGSAGYDLFSAVDLTIPPQTRRAIPLDIAITPLLGTYAQILSRSGLSLKHQIDVRAGTIDRDYTGNVQVLLENLSDTPYSVRIGDRIAQMVLMNIQTPPVHH